MSTSARFLVLGASGGTGKHFVTQALSDGHRVRALVRNPAKLSTTNPNLEIRQGSITDGDLDTDSLVKGVDYVVAMVGDKKAQENNKICYALVQKLVPSMRRNGVKRFMYQAGAFSKPYDGQLSWILWALRNTIVRSGGFEGQHRDNEAVMEYLATQANDIEWMVHRAGIGSDGPSKGILKRSNTKFSVGTHRDCAVYNYLTVMDESAVHSCDFSVYGS